MSALKLQTWPSLLFGLMPIVYMLLFTFCDQGDCLRQADLMVWSGMKVWENVMFVISGISFVRS